MDYRRLPDEDLVRRFREGEAAAFEALVERYSRSIYNFALRLLANGADAEDASQSTFVQAFESLNRRPPAAPLRPWLFQVAHNKCIDLIRRRRTVSLSTLDISDPEIGEVGPPDPAPLPPEIYERAELQELLQSAIGLLPVRAREVVIMRYVNDLTFAEIGEALGIPENTAKTWFQRAKGALREYLRGQL